MGIRVRVPPQGGLLSWENFGKRVATVINELDDTINLTITNPPQAMLRQTVAQSLPNNATTALTFDVEDYDTVAGHDTVTNNSRWTVPVGYAGWYELAGGAGFASNASNIRTTQWLVNGVDIPSAQIKVNATNGATTCMGTRVITVHLNEGDYVQLGAFQNSGGALNTSVVSNEQSHMSITFKRR